MADQLRAAQDAPIWNAIEANNFKQALKLVDKRLAKRHTDYLEALKIYIRSRSPQVPEKSAVLLHLEELPERKPPLADIEAIELYDEALDEVLPKSNGTWERIIGQLRWQCVKAQPKNEDLSLKCFQACLSKNALDHARQIANSLEKNFPRNHSYIFWNITMMFLYSTSENCPDNQKKIWGGLALGQIGKLAGATREVQDQKQLPIRSIQTPQELLLLDRITAAYGKSELRLEYLQSSQLGPESIVAKGEWQLWRTKLQLMEAAQQWQELFDTAAALLKRARTKDDSSQLSESQLSDWIVWEAFIRSVVELGGSQHTSKVQAEVQAHLDPASGIDKSWRRNASLAKLKLLFEGSTAFSSLQLSSKEGNGNFNKVTAITNYLREYGKASTAYNDLRPFVESLSPLERKELVENLKNNNIFSDASKTGNEKYPTKGDHSTAGEITQVINTYKLRYLLSCALPEHERIQSPTKAQADFNCTLCSQPCGLMCKPCLEVIAKEAIQSYRVAMDDDGRISKTLLKTDQHPADDLSILAAMCLIKLSLMSAVQETEPLTRASTTYALQASALLESAWLHSKHNFQMSLMLIRLYKYLGCGSLAMRAYHRLSLKQIQLDTLTYTVFDRFSSLDVHASSRSTAISSKERTPLSHLQEQSNLYKSSQEKITKNIWLSFKHGSYNSIFEMREVSEMLSGSIAAAMSVIESRKISRLTEPGTSLTDVSHGFDLLPPNMEFPDSEFSDNLDYGSYPNFETSSGPKFEQLSRYTPSLSAQRCRLNLAAEKLISIVDPSSDVAQEKELLHLWLKQYLDSQKPTQPAKVKSEGMTCSEQLAADTFYAMALILRASHDQDQWAENDFQARLGKYNTDLVESLEEQLALIENLKEPVPAFGNTLHVLYTAHEAGRTILNFCKYVSKQGKGFVEKQKEASTKINELAKKLLQLVVDKCAVVKKGLDEGGWIDKVLECTLPEAQEGSDGEVVMVALRELLDENFLEEWAGDVVESWRESMIGLSYLKAPSKA
ncbi:hypothetical protein N431DRAFT_424923 [Stipitochalara longipes BDJ]|nr:hypothetical protein N431DRAFT_424923 [Stipitochalara longipes BDJ]